MFHCFNVNVFTRQISHSLYYENPIKTNYENHYNGDVQVKVSMDHVVGMGNTWTRDT